MREQKPHIKTYVKAENKFIDLVYEKLNEMGLTMQEFCEQNYLPFYMTNKVLDKKIKMAVDPTFLKKIAKLLNIEHGTLLGQQPTCKAGGDYSQRVRTIY